MGPLGAATRAPLESLLYVRAPGPHAVFCAKLHHDNRQRCIFCEGRGEPIPGGGRGRA